jgi:predicted nucleotide-binding protein
VVHGHEEAPREAVARFLERLGFDVVILHEQANKGRAIITKFREEAADIGFAVVLMTPDDHGGKAGEPTRPRARQNVVFEFGFFIGALGPERVAALVKGALERPSDLDGVVYIDFDSAEGWQKKLGQELSAAGFEIDWNKVMRGSRI